MGLVNGVEIGEPRDATVRRGPELQRCRVAVEALGGGKAVTDCSCQTNRARALPSR